MSTPSIYPVSRSRNQREGYYAGYYPEWNGRPAGHRRWSAFAMGEFYPHIGGVPTIASGAIYATITHQLTPVHRQASLRKVLCHLRKHTRVHIVWVKKQPKCVYVECDEALLPLLSTRLSGWHITAYTPEVQ